MEKRNTELQQKTKRISKQIARAQQREFIPCVPIGDLLPQSLYCHLSCVYYLTERNPWECWVFENVLFLQK